VEGNLLDASGRYAIVAARFNDFITSKLVEGAVHALGRHGADTTDLPVVWVPGAFELPIVCQKLAASGKYDAILALGCVIRGGTPHFDYVCSGVTNGLTQVSVITGIPIGFGVLTCDDDAQALDRAGLPGSSEDKGYEAAMAAVATAVTVGQLAPRRLGV
jgi:6,7-dimethyl-8-ribityllumazine synthase